jgi:hypothetical protein
LVTPTKDKDSARFEVFLTWGSDEPLALPPRASPRTRNFSVVFVFEGRRFVGKRERTTPMNGIIYLIGLVVVVMLILSFLGLR